jgi:hypothetical protein
MNIAEGQYSEALKKVLFAESWGSAGTDAPSTDAL